VAPALYVGQMTGTSPGEPRSPALTLVNLITENVDHSRWLPVGSLYVIGALEEAGFEVEFRDFQLFEHPDPYNPEVIAEWLARSRSEVIGIGLMIDMLPVTLMAVARLKELRPEVKVVLAGPGPSNLTDEILSRHPAVDVIVRGEGELTAVDLVGALGTGGDLAGIAGIAYRDRDGIHTTAHRPRNNELTDLPMPAYHRVDWRDYRTVGVVLSRGCIFKCTFCEIPFIWQQGVQRRGIDGIVAELRHLKEKYGVKRVEILDDLFVSNRKWTREFCQAMIREKVGIEWTCFGYISLMNEELMELMAQAGCEGIFYGIEAGSQTLLEKTGKKFGIDEARATVLKTTKYMKPTSSFIWNYPFETMKDFSETITELVYLHNHGSEVRLCMLSPLKPTPFGQSKDPIRFDEDLWCGLLRRKRYIQAKELIKSDPDLFGAFYHFESEGFRTKLKLVENLLRHQDA
jgi:anaerobic magnesium-protoporphyrin IX monomethyl ester cyclase